MKAGRGRTSTEIQRTGSAGARKWRVLPAALALAGIAATFGVLCWEGLFGQAVWIAALAGLTWWRAEIGVSLLFLAVSIDAPLTIGGISVDFSELEFLVCCLAFAGTLPTRQSVPDWRPLAWGAPFAAAVLLSSLATSEWHRVLPHVLRLSEFSVGLSLAASAFRSMRSHRVFLGCLTAAAVFHVSAALIQALTTQEARAFSFFANANQFGAYLNLLLAPLLMLGLRSPRKSAAFWIPTAVLVSAGLLLSQSRAAWLAGAATVLLLVLLARGQRAHLVKRAGYGAAAAAVLVLMAGLAAALMTVGNDSAERQLDWIWRSFKHRSSPSYLLDSAARRVFFLEVGYRVWRDHPWVGTGPGNLEEALEPELAEFERHAPKSLDLAAFRNAIRIHFHNLAIQLAAMLGLFGLASFIYLMARLFGEFWKRRRSFVWGWAGIGVLFAFAIHDLWDVTFPSLGLEMGIVLGALSAGAELHAIGTESEERRSEEDPVGRRGGS